MTITYLWSKLGILRNCKPRSTWNNICICAATFDLCSKTESPLSDATHFVILASRTAPP